MMQASFDEHVHRDLVVDRQVRLRRQAGSPQHRGLKGRTPARLLTYARSGLAHAALAFSGRAFSAGQAAERFGQGLRSTMPRT